MAEENRVDTIYNMLQKYLNEKDVQEKILADLQHNYSSSKKALQDKLNSETDCKKSENKNSKVSNKISLVNAETFRKIKYFEECLRQNEEKRFNEKKAIDDKCDKYLAYINSQKELLEEKGDIKIRDLSSNIIETTIYKELDENAYPTLTKMKEHIRYEKTKYDKIFNECNKLHSDYKRCLDKDNERKLELIQINERIALQKEEDKRQLAIYKSQQDKLAEKEAEEARYIARRQKAIEEAEEKEGLTLEEEEALEKEKEENRNDIKKNKIRKIKEFYAQKNRKAKLDNLSDKQSDKFQKLDTFTDKAKFLDALPDPEDY
jgi:hypothetical protein